MPIKRCGNAMSKWNDSIGFAFLCLCLCLCELNIVLNPIIVFILAGWLVAQVFVRLADWLDGWLVGLLAWWLAGWLVWWLVGLSADWLVGWLILLTTFLGTLCYKIKWFSGPKSMNNQARPNQSFWTFFWLQIRLESIDFPDPKRGYLGLTFYSEHLKQAAPPQKVTSLV